MERKGIKIKEREKRNGRAELNDMFQTGSSSPGIFIYKYVGMYVLRSEGVSGMVFGGRKYI